eukprot:PITA_28003
MQKKDYLYQRDLYLPLSGKTRKPTSMIDTEWDILNRKALRTIQLCLAASVAFNISKKMITEGLMLALAKLYENPQPQIRALLFLCSFLESWNGLVMAISNSVSGSSTLNFDDVVGAILSEEMRWKSSGETSGNALIAETRGRKMERGKSSGYRSKSRKGSSKSRLGIVCWKCGKKGHSKKDCKSRKGKEEDV